MKHAAAELQFVYHELSHQADFAPHYVHHQSGFTGVLAGCDKKQAHLSITAPKEMEALSGSCLQIPCSFATDQTTFNSTGTIYGVWIKNKKRFTLNPNNVVFNSSKSANIYQMKITGNLSQKNCTTLFPDLKTTHTDRYFFRIENGPFRATASCNPIQITVKGEKVFFSFVDNIMNKM